MIEKIGNYNCCPFAFDHLTYRYIFTTALAYIHISSIYDPSVILTLPSMLSFYIPLETCEEFYEVFSFLFTRYYLLKAIS